MQGTPVRLSFRHNMKIPELPVGQIGPVSEVSEPQIPRLVLVRTLERPFLSEALTTLSGSVIGTALCGLLGRP